MTKQKFYDRYVTTHYQYVTSTSATSFKKRYYVWKSYLENYLPEKKSARILEIGAGLGHNLSALKQMGYTNVIGTDYSQECVTSARQAGFDVRLINSRTEHVFYKKHAGEFDTVILYDVIEHYTPDDAITLLKKVYGLLKKNGSVFISLPNADHPFSNALMFVDITHKFIYSKNSLSQLLRNSGFENMLFFQINSLTTYDDQFIMRFVKVVIFSIISFIGESIWRLLAYSQGITLTECKPTLVSIARKS